MSGASPGEGFPPGGVCSAPGHLKGDILCLGGRRPTSPEQPRQSPKGRASVQGLTVLSLAQEESKSGDFFRALPLF